MIKKLIGLKEELIHSK